MITIYRDVVTLPNKAEDRLAFYASERFTCEQLLVMGYNFSGHMNLQSRVRTLNANIAGLEAQIAQAQRNHSKPRRA